MKKPAPGRSSRGIALFAVVLAARATLLPAQQGWVRPAGPFQLIGRFGVRLADDSARARVVLFGGRSFATPFDETWEWDGIAWTERTPAQRPPRRSFHAMAYDPLRGVVLVFGGSDANGAVLGDLWQWDGAAWTQRTSVTGPSPRTGAAFAFDVGRGRAVLVGGSIAGGALVPDPHWEWDGTAWVPGPSGLPPRTAASVAYDPVRARTVVFGGAGACFAFSCPTFADTWEFDGLAWTQRVVAGPPARADAGMTFDPLNGRVLLHGGRGNCVPACVTTFADAWSWDGVAWVQRSSAAPRVHSGGLAWDAARGTGVAFGGIRAVPLYAGWLNADTDGCDGTNWSPLAMASMPPGLGQQAIAYDSTRGRSVWFGNAETAAPGRAETWEWDGIAWARQAPPVSPPPRSLHAMSYDSLRQRVVLFGGTATSGSFLGDTWEWDGATWVQRVLPASPPAQYGHAMAFDAARGVTVLYPGAFGGGIVQEYDGTTWTPRPVAGAPPYRLYTALAYDERRARTVLFGGTGGGLLDDCWEWDGTTWWPTAPTVRPPGRSGAALAYDPVRGRTILYGGAAAGGVHGDVWEWDGADWTPKVVTASPLPRQNPGFVFDRTRGRAVMFGGYAAPGGGTLQDTWELLTPCDRAGPGEVGGGGLPLACVSLPQLGATFCVTFTDPSPAAAGLSLLLVGAGPCLSPAPVVGPPLTCAASFAYAAPLVALTAAGNPVSFCLPLPANPAFVGAPLCLQGAALESPGCLRATDGLVVVLQ